MSEVQEFMNRQSLVSFATMDPGNRPHVVSVFFNYDDGKVYVHTDRISVKVRNLSRSDNVAVAVYNGEEAVIIKGKGWIIVDNEEFIRRTQDHIEKYGLKIDEQGKDSLGIPLFDSKVRRVVEVASRKTLYW